MIDFDFMTHGYRLCLTARQIQYIQEHYRDSQLSFLFKAVGSMGDHYYRDARRTRSLMQLYNEYYHGADKILFNPAPKDEPIPYKDQLSLKAALRSLSTTKTSQPAPISAPCQIRNKGRSTEKTKAVKPTNTKVVYDLGSLSALQEFKDVESYTPADLKNEHCTSDNWMYCTGKHGHVRHQIPCSRSDGLCPTCVKRTQNKIYRLVFAIFQLAHLPIHFVTITMPDVFNPLTGDRIEETYQQQYDRFRVAWRNMRRGLPPFTFFRVFEFGSKSNRIHAHMLVVGDCPFPEADRIYGNRVEQWLSNLSPEARARYEYLESHGLGYYTCERLEKGAHAAISYMAKYLTKAESFPWQDIEGIRLHGSSSDFPKPVDVPSPFDIRNPFFTVENATDDEEFMPDYTTTQYASYTQDTRLSVIQDDISFQLEGIQHPDTIQGRHAEIQDLETRVNRMRLEIPHDIRRTLHDTSSATPYVVGGHLFFTRQYPPSTSLVNPPADPHEHALLDCYIHEYNTLQTLKRDLREYHHYIGTRRFLDYYMIATSNPMHYAKSNRRIESHYYEYYIQTGRDPDKDGIPYRMLVAINCVDNDPTDPTVNQPPLEPYIQ